MRSDAEILNFLATTHKDFKGKTLFRDIFTIQYWDINDLHRDFDNVLMDCYEHSLEGTAWLIVYEKNGSLHLWETGDLELCWIVLVDSQTLYSKRVAPQQARNRPECGLCMSSDGMMYASDDVYIPCPSCSPDKLNDM
jgi:hypothetical protein